MNIYLIDDEPRWSKYVASEVELTTNINQADIILCSPGRIIEAIGKSKPVVVASGQPTTRESIMMYRNRDVVNYIPKDFTNGKLRSILNDMA